jgi:hypothetical protein
MKTLRFFIAKKDSLLGKVSQRVLLIFKGVIVMSKFLVAYGGKQFGKQASLH